jgi:hypothetical protein
MNEMQIKHDWLVTEEERGRAAPALAALEEEGWEIVSVDHSPACDYVSILARRLQTGEPPA